MFYTFCRPLEEISKGAFFVGTHFLSWVTFVIWKVILGYEVYSLYKQLSKRFQISQWAPTNHLRYIPCTIVTACTFNHEFCTISHYAGTLCNQRLVNIYFDNWKDPFIGW